MACLNAKQELICSFHTNNVNSALPIMSFIFAQSVNYACSVQYETNQRLGMGNYIGIRNKDSVRFV